MNRMNRIEIIVGEKYGRLTAIKQTTPRGGKWECRCECGTTGEFLARSLRSGNVQSCGCLRREKAGQVSKIACSTHGLSTHPLYPLYKAIMAKCNDPNHDKYPFFGGIGIRVCDRWSEPVTGIQRFVADVGDRPIGRRLSRKNVLGNFEPGNVEWRGAAKQPMIDAEFSARIPGEIDRFSLSQLHQITGVDRSTLRNNLSKLGLATILMTRGNAT